MRNMNSRASVVMIQSTRTIKNLAMVKILGLTNRRHMGRKSRIKKKRKMNNSYNHGTGRRHMGRKSRIKKKRKMNNSYNHGTGRRVYRKGKSFVIRKS
jgi:hypothetical protein